MKICIISDVHGHWDKITVPPCDILISCGDYSFKGEGWMVKGFHKWLDKQKAKHVISLQGNHEVAVENYYSLSQSIALEECKRVHFVSEDVLEIEGVKFFCSSVTPWFGGWAWNMSRGEELRKHWELIPEDTNILVTHGPPAGILDLVPSKFNNLHETVGCTDLLNKVKQLKDLKLHCFGHIHEQSGVQVVEGVTFINASICNDQYVAAYPVREFEYEK